MADEPETEKDKRAADQLCDVLLAIEDVDLNALIDDEVRTLLDAKDDVSEICLRCRNDQHVLAERARENSTANDARNSTTESDNGNQ